MNLTVLPAAQTAFRDHVTAWNKCLKCKIGELAFKHVFARGTLPCDVLFIGEAPGKSEDVIGLPFVGPAGKVFETWVDNVPYTWAVTNLVSCRPTVAESGPNRQPTEAEQVNCQPRLSEFIKLAKPRAIVFLGKLAENSWVGVSWNLSEIVAPDVGVPYLVLRHPAYVLRRGGILSPGNQFQIDKLKQFTEEHLCQRSS